MKIRKKIAGLMAVMLLAVATVMPVKHHRSARPEVKQSMMPEMAFCR